MKMTVLASEIEEGDQFFYQTGMVRVLCNPVKSNDVFNTYEFHVRKQNDVVQKVRLSGGIQIEVHREAMDKPSLTKLVRDVQELLDRMGVKHPSESQAKEIIRMIDIRLEQLWTPPRRPLEVGDVVIMKGKITKYDGTSIIEEIDIEGAWRPGVVKSVEVDYVQLERRPVEI